MEFAEPNSGVCAYTKCRQVFTPHRRRPDVPWTKCCSLSCGKHRAGELARERGMAPAHAGRRAAAADALREELGRLTTDGELDAFRLGYRRGYRNGAYQRSKGAAA